MNNFPLDSTTYVPRKSTPARSVQACLACRRMKIRCMREGDGRCQRCVHLDEACVFAPKARRGAAADASRPAALTNGGSTATLPSTSFSTTGPVSFLSPTSSGQWEGNRRDANERILDRHRAGTAVSGISPGLYVSTSQSVPRNNPTDLTHAVTNPADPPSPSDSSLDDDTEDLLSANHLAAPFQQLKSLAEARDMSRATSQDPDPTSHASVDDHIGSVRTRHEVPQGSDGALAATLLEALDLRPGGMPSAMVLGEAESRELYDYFFASCSDYVLVHDRKVDTWSALRSKRPLSLAAIIAVAAKARDGAKFISDSQMRAMQMAQALILGTIFCGTHTMADVQGVITLGIYHHNGWRLCGHAIRLATELGLDRALETLLPIRDSATVSEADSARQSDLVIGARTWFALCAQELQMCFGNGRWPSIRLTTGPSQYRKFLEHPMSIPSDVRSVALTELLMLRAPLHLSFDNPVNGSRESLLATLQRLKVDLDEWYTYYDRIMQVRLGLEPTSYYRESLRTQREYTSLFANSLLLRGISQPADLRRLSDDEYILALGSIRGAQVCIEIVVRGTSYPNMLRFAIPHTHMSVAFAASFLLRTSTLFPDRIDADVVKADVESVAALLAKCGSNRLSKALRIMLSRASGKKGRKAAKSSHSADDSPGTSTQGPLSVDPALVPLSQPATNALTTSQTPSTFALFDPIMDPTWDMAYNGLFMTGETDAGAHAPAINAAQLGANDFLPNSDFNALMESFGPM